MGSDRARPWRRAAAGIAVTALTALGLVAFASAASAADGDAQVTVSKTADLDPAGESITVTGSGFDPTGNLGTHPPLAGQPAGVYVVTGKFSPVWQPSAGAPTSARQVIDQIWAAPGAPAMLVGNPAYVPMNDDGTFTATVKAAETDEGPADGVYGVYVYPASGAVNPAEELAVPITFAAPAPTTSPAAPTTTATPAAPDAPDEVTATLISAPATPEVQCTTESVPATAGAASLNWAVKTSFLTYVDGALADGAVTTGAGAVWNGRTVTWGTGTGSLGTSSGSVTFPGTLHLTGHGGVLDVTFSNLTVKVTGASTGVLEATVASTDTSGKDVSASGPLADLTFTSLSAAGGTASATLTAAGAQAFAGFYQPGEALDPVTITVAAGTAAHTVQRCVDADGNLVNPDGTPIDALASTGIDTAGMTQFAAALTAAGVLLLVLGRRRASRHRP